jgi:hypothetical protein
MVAGEVKRRNRQSLTERRRKDDDEPPPLKIKYTEYESLIYIFYYTAYPLSRSPLLAGDQETLRVQIQLAVRGPQRLHCIVLLRNGIVACSQGRNNNDF